MPSKLRQLYYFGLRAAAWLLWLPLTGDLTHDRTYGELKRLQPKEAAVLLVPLCCYALVGSWLYLMFPPQMYTWAVSVFAVGVGLGGTLLATSVATAKVADWSLYHTSR